MAPTPFEHGLALAWSDGALSREGAIMLETLQKQLGLSDKERAVQEQSWLSEMTKTPRRSFGDGDQILIDATLCDEIDPFVLGTINEYITERAPTRGVQATMVGFQSSYPAPAG